MRDLTAADFTTLWPAASKPLWTGILTTQDGVWASCGITKAIRLAHFMAQISHESGCGSDIVESLNYTPAALLSQWPSHFTPDLANRVGRTAQHAADQRAIGNAAYGGRMGNVQPDDGYNFRGHGLLQITGRTAFKTIGGMCGLDLQGHPELTVDPLHCLVVAATEFKVSGCLPYADQDDVTAVSALVNVGHWPCNPASIIGLDKRKEWLAKWKGQLGI